MNPAMKKHLELQIKTLQKSPRDLDKLERLLIVRLRQKVNAMHIEDILQKPPRERLKC